MDSVFCDESCCVIIHIDLKKIIKTQQNETKQTNQVLYVGLTYLSKSSYNKSNRVEYLCTSIIYTREAF